MPANSTVNNIGKPLDSVSAFIIQPQMEKSSPEPFGILPQGHVGELAVGGYQLAEGYLNRHEETESAFIQTPYGRLYRTGDKARFLPDGTIECLGRLSDGQVKLRGQRLELGEVQQAILRTPGCHGAVAAVQGSVLLAFCAVESAVTEDAILDECRRWLPQFMVPGETILMDELPKLPSGKVDRKRIISDFIIRKESHIPSDAGDDVPIEFTTMLSRLLAQLIQPFTTLAAAGVDSLTAIRVASSLREEGWHIDVATLLRKKTVRELWYSLQPHTNEDKGRLNGNIAISAHRCQQILSQEPLLQGINHLIQEILPCTRMQASMLAQTSLRPDIYWNEIGLEIDATAQEFIDAMSQVVNRNDIFRTCFVHSEDSFFSVVLKDIDPNVFKVVTEFKPLQQDLSNVIRPMKIQIQKQSSNGHLSAVVHVHHAIYDGWSMDMFLSDISDILDGSEPPVRQKFHWVIELDQRAPLEQELAGTMEYWASELHGWAKEPSPKLLGDHVELSAPVVNRRFLRIDPEAVENMSSRFGCRPHVLFQASLALVWSGISGSLDTVLGIITAGRTLPLKGIENIMGPCIASFPLRTNLNTVTTVAQLLSYIQARNFALLEHSMVSLSDLRKFGDLQASDNLYDVLFVYQKSPWSKQRLNQRVKEVRHCDRLETKLLFEVEPQDEGFDIQTTHHPDFMDSDMALSLISQVEDIAQEVVRNPQQSVQSLRQRLSSQLALHNEAPAKFRGTPDLATIFEEMTMQQPQETALCFAKSGLDGRFTYENITYDALNCLGNRIAHFLLSNGLGTRQVVGIIMEKSVLLYASILGIIKAGCAYLPILPSTPIERVREISQQAKLRHCLVDEGSSQSFSDLGGLRLLNMEEAPLSRYNDGNLNITVDGNRLAYVIYTSGTTGVPKGVAVTQLNIMSNIDHLLQTYPANRKKQPKILQACSQAFDVSVFEIFFAWHAGFCLCAGTNDTVFEDLEYTIAELEVTHLSLTPTVAALVDPQKTPTVEFLVTAGEPLTKPVLDRWGPLLWQGYGPSETTNICSVKHMKRGMHIEHLGHAFSNTSVAVLAPKSLQSLPYGWVGELCFGGDQVAEGYLNAPHLTAERFTQHFRLGRIHRSGDLGRMLPDGSLIIIGRLDDQIKLRGQRIEAGEICSLITGTGAATSAVAMIARKHERTPDQLIAFYVPTDVTSGVGPLDIEKDSHMTIFSVLQSKLPAYMVPSYIVPLAKIPLTSSGKLDYRRLREWFQNLPTRYLEAAAFAPHTDRAGSEWSSTESRIAETIKSHMALGDAKVNKWASFATFGIDSVSAIALARRLGTSLGCRVPVSTIIQHPSVAQLGRCLDAVSPPASPASVSNIFSRKFVRTIEAEFSSESKAVEAVLPCTPLQEAMLSGSQRSYYNKILFRLRLSPGIIHQCWEEACSRHGILRTCFVATDETERPIAQVVLRDWQIPWRTMDPSSLSVDLIVSEHLRQLPNPVDSKIPPVSLATFRLKSQDYLSFICHHALYDGVAMDNLWREIETLAHNLTLPAPVSYQPFLRHMLTPAADVEGFWKSQMSGFQPSHLFRTLSHEINQSITSKPLTMPLDEVQSRLRSLGATMLSLCQSSWSRTLALMSDYADVCFGNVISGRTIDVDGVDQLVAPCFNTLPLRANTNGFSQGHEVLKYFHQLNQKLLPYQFTPLRLIQKLANRPGRRLFETLLLLQKPLENIDDQVWTLEEDSGDMDVPMVCEFVPCPHINAMFVKLHVDTNTVDAGTASSVLELLELSFQSFLHNPYEDLLQRHSLPEALRSSLQDLIAVPDDLISSNNPENKRKDWTETELCIRAVFSKLSNQKPSQISRQTTISQLGLDSINAVQVASLLRRRGLSVSATDVIEFPSCEKLGAHISLHQSPETKDSATTQSTFGLEVFTQKVKSEALQTIPSDIDVEAILPATPIQCAMLTSSSETNGRNYLNCMVYEIDLGLKRENLLRSWEILACTHPMLRTGFVPVTYRHTTFAMVRCSSSWMKQTFLSHWSESTESNVRSLVDELANRFAREPGSPPWHLLFARGKQTFTMKIIIHHALYDATSFDMLLDHLSQILSGEATPDIKDIEPALDETISNGLGDHAGAETFWQSKKENAIVNKFPVMTPLREPVSELKIETLRCSSSLSGLQTACTKQGVSIQALIQASWTRILSTYLGEDTVVFGMTLSGRSTEVTKHSALPCLVTLPIVGKSLSSNYELLQYMMEYNASLHRFQHTPLGLAKKWLGHPSSPIFDTLVSYRRTKTPTRPFKLVEDHAQIEYPVSLEVEANDQDELLLSISYKENFLPQEQAALLLQQFNSTLRHLAFCPSSTGNSLHETEPALFSITPPEIAEMESPVRLLHKFVEIKAQSQPHRVALQFADSLHGASGIESRTWTYQELDRMGNGVANLISDIAPVGSIVAVCFNKCPEAYFSILGILKAGCSFVALDPTAPSARKEFILRDCNASSLLFEADEVLDFDTGAISTIRISEKILQASSSSSCQNKEKMTPNLTCYCLYTSGTTGTPKGCEITHENAVQAMMSFQDLFRGHWDTDSRWLQFAALHFDVSVLEQYWSWSVGITVVAAPKDMILDDLTWSINQLGITHIDLTPSLARLTHPDEIPSLCRGVFITGGESLKQEILDVWGPAAVIYNAYGPTEATIGVTMYQRVPINGRPSNIGKQFPNVGSYVFQPGTNIPVLRGGVGELCVSGKLVGKGYLGRPDLTAQKFPFLENFGERIYRTGDLVRILHDGCFDFLGRADDQVKLRGQRLEIGEINHVIRGVPEVQDVATIVASRTSEDKNVLVSFLVSHHSLKMKKLRIIPDEEDLGQKVKEACRNRLPTYMVPTYFFVLPYIPLSVNNKAETKELTRLFGDLSSEELMKHVALTSVATRANVDLKVLRKVINALSEFSGVDVNGISENSTIFDIGVDSISATRLSSFLKQTGFASASPSKLLLNPVVLDLTQALSDASALRFNETRAKESKQLLRACHHRHRSFICRELGVPADDIEYIAPCSALQEGMVSAALTSSKSNVYFNSFTLRLHSSTSVDRVQSAFDQLVYSESILRTVFFATASGTIQVALKNHPIKWNTLNVDDKAHVVEILNRERQSWIQTNSTQIKQPLQFTIVRKKEETFLHMNAFHAIYDGISLETMLSRVARAVKQQNSPSGPPFVEALIHGPLQNFESCRSFWEEHLRQWVPSPLQSRFPLKSGGPAVARLELPGRNIEMIRTAQNITLQAVLLSLWISVLQQRFSSGLTLGLIVSGRSIDLPQAEHTVGPLFNTLPFFNRTLIGHTWASLAHECHRFSASTLPFQHVPLHKIQKWCSSGKPLFDCLFTLQVESRNEHGQQDVWSVVDQEPHAEYPLALEITYTSEGTIKLVLVAQSHVADDTMLDELLECFASHQELMASDPGQPIPVNNEAGKVSSESKSITYENGNEAVNGFVWTSLATSIRDHIASLAQVAPSEIAAFTGLLELGLDSIDVLKLSAKLREKGIVIPASRIMRLQSVAAISASVSDTDVDEPSRQNDDLDVLQKQLKNYLENSGFDLSEVETILPATPLQESMVSSMVESDFEQYFNHDVLQIGEGIDLPKLKRAWDSVIEAMPILRTGFVEVDDPAFDISYCQVVWQSASPWSQHNDKQDSDGIEESINEANRIARAGSARRDLLRLRFVTSGSDDFLVLSVAHALYDGWSLSLLYQELRRAYDGQQLEGCDSRVFFKNLLKFESRRPELFWKDYLQDANPTKISKSPAETTGQDHVVRREAISTINPSRMRSVCQRLSVSIQSICQACWAIVLAHLSQQLDVTYGVIMSGRDFDGAERLMFPTMNTVAVRYVLHGSVHSFLQYVEATLGDVRENQHFPLRRALMGAACQAGDLFNTLFLLQKSPSPDNTGLPLKSVRAESAVDYPVCVEAEETDNQLHWRVACQSLFVSESEVSQLISNLDQVMGYLTSNTESEVLSFSQGRVSICDLPQVQLASSEISTDVDDTHVRSEADWDETSRTIRDVLSLISGIPSSEVRLSNSLFHIGLDSISAVKASALLRRKGVQLRPRDLIKANSIHHMGLLASIEGNEHQTDLIGNGNELSPLPLKRAQDILHKHNILAHDVEAIMPALPMQVYMLGTWQNFQGSVFYPEFTYLCDYNCSREAIVDAWAAVIASTPLLRTCFVAAADRDVPVLQVVLKPSSVVSSRNVEAPVKLKTDWAEERQVWLVRLKIHHALYDGVSLPFIMQKMSRILTGNSDDVHQDNNSIEKWLSYTTNQATEKAKSTRKEFWSSYLSGCRGRSPEPHGTAYPIGRVSLIQRSALPDTTHVQRRAAQCGVSVQALFMAAYAKVISGFEGVQALDHANGPGDPHGAPVVFGVYLANQSGDDELPAIYPRLNLVPLKVGVRGGGGGVDEGVGGGLADMAGCIQRDLLEIRSHGREHVGLWEIDDWTGVKISSFVNFLSLPDIGDGDDGDHIAFKIRPADDDPMVSRPAQDDHDGLGIMGDVLVRDTFLVSYPSFFNPSSVLSFGNPRDTANISRSLAARC